MDLFLKKIIKSKITWTLCLLVFPVVILAAGQFATTTQFSSTLSDAVQVGISVTCPSDICAFQGCTAPAATNYNAEAGYDDGSCTYSPTPQPTTPPTLPVLGCTDPTATNYNANATVDNGSCQYNIPNVGNFTVTKNGTSAHLTWTIPTFAQFSSVVIVKSERIPTGPTDGEVIYNGGGRSVNDNAITAGVTYYYLALIKSQGGAYSSGALTSYKDEETSPVNGCTDSQAINYNPVATHNDGSCVYLPGQKVNGCTDSGATNYNPAATHNNGSCAYLPGEGGGGDQRPPGGIIGSGPVLPFERLPVANLATSSELKIMKLFVFKQVGEKTKPFFDGGRVSIRGNKPFTISVDYYKMPEVLKTIGVTLSNINDPNQSFSFLMKLNADKTAYEATVGAMSEDGVYAVSIYLINYQDQTIKKFNGQLAIVGSLGIFGVGTEKFVKQVAGPVAVTGGVTAGIFQLLFASGNIASFSDIYLLLLRQIGVLLGLLGLKKKNKPWGTVYDSVTKRPIDPAYVTILANQEAIATAITDIDGRYGFSLLDGNYTLKADKTHYRFPSSQLNGRINDEMYDNLYFGDLFHVLAGEVINKNIPLDPVSFDWNEFVKGKGDYFKLFTSREILRSKIIHYIYMAGFIMSIFYLIFYPSILNILVPILYLAINFFGRYWTGKHKVVSIKNAVTNEPISFAIVRIFYADLDQEIKRVVADMVGRFYLLVRPGTYYLTIDHKQPDGTYARIYKSPVTELKKGVWKENILI